MNRMDKAYEESQLLAMLSEDSHPAFQLLFERYKDHIYKVARLYVKSPVIAEEIVQEVFLKVWVNRKHLFLIRSFESWLYVVSRNMVVNYAKRMASEWKASHLYAAQNEYSEDMTDHKVRNAQYEELLRKALLKLPKQQSLIFKLAKEEKLSYLEIAMQLKISPLTVKTHLSRGLHAIRSYLKDHGEIIVIFLCTTSFY